MRPGSSATPAAPDRSPRVDRGVAARAALVVIVVVSGGVGFAAPPPRALVGAPVPPRPPPFDRAATSAWLDVAATCAANRCGLRHERRSIGLDVTLSRAGRVVAARVIDVHDASDARCLERFLLDALVPPFEGSTMRLVQSAIVDESAK